MTLQKIEDNPFWNFSIKFYAEDSVADWLLKLQENCKADVNLLLFCMWVAYQDKQQLTDSEINFYLSALEPLQGKVVKPIRKIRKGIKQMCDSKQNTWCADAYKQIKVVEIEAEREEQFTIYKIYMSKRKKPLKVSEMQTLARSNVLLYLKKICNNLGGHEKEIVDRLLIRLFEKSSP